MQLRYMQMLTEIGGKQNSTSVFPLPMDLMESFLNRGNGAKPEI